MSAETHLRFDIEQGSYEWLALRKTKITATDAAVIMGASHWKTKIQLYNEKKSNEPPEPPTERMQRGLDLEPVARQLFILEHGTEVYPAVAILDWAMASLDGVDSKGRCVVEIKCPGDKDHAIALQGKVPDHYYPQLQHQIYVMGIEDAYYYSFDGMDGVTVHVKRDDEYIKKMLIEERKFYECLINNTPPEPDENDYVERNDDLWEELASKWLSVTTAIKDLEIEQENLRTQLIFMSGESNAKGAGISLCQIKRKGTVDYSKIPQLKGVNLDAYRKAEINTWRITTH